MPGSEEFLTYFPLAHCCLLVRSDSLPVEAACVAFCVCTLVSADRKARTYLRVICMMNLNTGYRHKSEVQYSLYSINRCRNHLKNAASYLKILSSSLLDRGTQVGGGCWRSPLMGEAFRAP